MDLWILRFMEVASCFRGQFEIGFYEIKGIDIFRMFFSTNLITGVKGHSLSYIYSARS